MNVCRLCAMSFWSRRVGLFGGDGGEIPHTRVWRVFEIFALGLVMSYVLPFGGKGLPGPGCRVGCCCASCFPAKLAYGVAFICLFSREEVAAAAASCASRHELSRVAVFLVFPSTRSIPFYGVLFLVSFYFQGGGRAFPGL